MGILWARQEQYLLNFRCVALLYVRNITEQSEEDYLNQDLRLESYFFEAAV